MIEEYSLNVDLALFRISESFHRATGFLPSFVCGLPCQLLALFRLERSHARLATFMAAFEPTFPAHLSHDLRNFIFIHINSLNASRKTRQGFSTAHY